MAQYRQSPSRVPTKKSNVWTGIFIGLIIGLVGAAVLAVWLGRSSPFADHNSNVQNNVTPSNPITPSAPIMDPVTHALPAQTSQHYDFYKMLPGAATNGVGTVGAPPPPATTDANTMSSTAHPALPSIWLQVGAFVDAQKADDLKARMALMGHEATVFITTKSDKIPEYHVRLGPYTEADAEKLQASLMDEHIASSLIKSDAIPMTPKSK